MTFRVRTIDQTAAGREIIREREIGKDAITIGRAAENDIHLPDLAIEQRHVSVSQTPSGQLKVEALGTLGFTLDGRATKSATLSPREGSELALGSYRLEFTSANDGTIAVTVRSADGNDGHGKEALRDWFRVLYETLLGTSQGPRMGSFFALYGIGNGRKLIAEALARAT